jgi:hypothetical protein
MVTMRCSVPRDVKESFDKTFARQNKSVVLTELLRQAANEHRGCQNRSKVIEKLLVFRKLSLGDKSLCPCD